MALINFVQLADAVDLAGDPVQEVWQAEDDITGELVLMYFDIGTSPADAQNQMGDADDSVAPPADPIQAKQLNWQYNTETKEYCAFEDDGLKVLAIKRDVSGGAVLTMFDTAGNPVIVPSCRLFATDQQSIPNSTWTAVNWPDENYDALDMHDVVTNNTRITIPTGADGKYLVSAGLGFSANGSGNRGIRILKNGVEEGQRSFVPNAGSGNFVTPSVSDVLDLVGGDYLEIAAWQNRGGSLTLIGVDADYNHFAVVKLD